MISSRIYIDTPINAYFYQDLEIASGEKEDEQSSSVIYQDHSLAERVVSKDDMLSQSDNVFIKAQLIN